MHRGEIVEQGPTAEVFARPKSPYTRLLLAAEPTGRKAPVRPDARELLAAQNLSVRFSLRRGAFRRRETLVAVDDASLAVRAGETVGVVGESGSGKSTLGRALLRLVPAEGRIVFDGARLDELDEDMLRPLRREMQVVFQDPFGSLSPRLTVGRIVSEGLLVHAPALSRAEREARAAAALGEVGLDPALMRRYAHELSGGQRQRVAIARALILKPKFMLLDEPTSALDRSVQKQIVDLLRDIQAAHGLAYVFISHDLAVVRAMADTVLVMHQGRIVERGPVDRIFEAPESPYTRALIAAALEHRVVAAEAAAG
jgi:oligopeptide transport system ATP-binding protein